jgi:hypothetical protein
LVWDPAFETRLRSLGLLDADASTAFRSGRLISLSSRREVWRLEDTTPVLYLKRTRGTPVSPGAPSGFFSRIKARLSLATAAEGQPAEWEHLRWLRDRGFEVSRPVAAGGCGRAWFVVTAELPGMDLVRFFRDSEDGLARLAVARATGEVLARLAEYGFQFEDFVGKHLHARRERERFIVGLLDVERVRRAPVGEAERVAMAADLLATVPDPAMRREEVRAFLSASFAGAGGTPWEALRTALRDRRERRRLRRFLAEDPERYLADRRLDDRGSLWRGDPPFESAGDALASIGRRDRWTCTGREYLIVCDTLAHIVRAFDAADQAFRFRLVARGLPAGLIVDPASADSALLVVEDAGRPSRDLVEHAAGDPAGAGSLLGRLHQAGLLSPGFAVQGGELAVADWRAVPRPDPVRESTLRRDLRRIAGALAPAASEEFQRSYGAARQPVVESLLVP